MKFGNGVYKVILPTKSDTARLRKVKDLVVDSDEKMFLKNGHPSKLTSAAYMIFW
jgi:hypothetical protein